MILKLIMIFFGGVVVDILITKYTRAIGQGRPTVAALLSGLITLGNLVIWGTILHEAETLGIPGALAMASGAAVGTFLGFRQRTGAVVGAEQASQAGAVAHPQLSVVPPPAPATASAKITAKPAGVATPLASMVAP